MNAIPAIEEVNIFKDDTVIQFVNPKGEGCLCSWIVLFTSYKLLIVNKLYNFFFKISVQASIAANTWVVSGSPQTKSMALILPSLVGIT